MDIIDSVELVTKYFPSLDERQADAFRRLETLYEDWNTKINVISRADTGNLYCRHVLHSLAIAKFLGELAPGTAVMDLGTGGGFPGIPLAIFYPQCRFHLIDRIGKKIRVATEIASAIGLENVTLQHGDSGECHDKFDFVVSRAVMQLDELVKISARLVGKPSRNRIPNGLICLKGGDLASELGRVKRPLLDIPLTDYFGDEYFAGKDIVYVEL